MPRKMRDSGVEWIGQVPEGWRVERLKNLFEFGKGLNITKADLVDNGVAVISYGQIHSKRNTGTHLAEELLRHVQVSYLQSDPTAILHQGDFVFADTSEDLEGLGNCAFIDDPREVMAGYHTIVFRPHDKAICKYLAYLFKSDAWRSQIRSVAYGIKVYSLTQRMLRECTVILPPLPTQRAIAAYLDARCGEIDAAVAAARRSIEDYKVLKKSLVFELVTGKNRSGRKVPSGVDWIGDVPADWPVCRIVSLYREVSERGDDSLPILSVSINTGVSDKELSDEEQERVFIRSEDKSKYKRVQSGDLTYNMMRAWQGAFGAVRVDGMVSPAYVVARPKAEIDSRYVEYLLRTPNATREMQRYSRGIADFRMRLYWPEFKNIKIPCPPLAEQRALADEIDAKCGAIDAVVAEKESLIADLEQYKKSLIFECVTGKREVA